MTLREVVPTMTLDGRAAQKSSRILKGTNAFLLLLAVILLIAGFPFFLFGVFLAISQGPDGIGGTLPWGSASVGLSRCCAHWESEHTCEDEMVGSEIRRLSRTCIGPER